MIEYILGYEYPENKGRDYRQMNDLRGCFIVLMIVLILAVIMLLANSQGIYLLGH